MHQSEQLQLREAELPPTAITAGRSAVKENRCVPWTWQEIESEWLGGTFRLADEPDVVVAAFERVESHFGREWMDAERTAGGLRSSGLAPTLGIVSTGKLLASLDGVLGVEALVAGLRERNEESMTEALAIHLLRAQADADIEYEPSILVRGRSRKPDLRARWGSHPWVYAEVAKPNDSEMKRASATVMKELVAQVHELPGSFAAEVFLRRRPNAAEVEDIKNRLSRLSRVPGASEVDLPDWLGKVFLNFTEPGVVILDDHGEGYRPGIGMAGTVINGDEHRHLVVRIAYSDARAEQFLRTEARQLPTDAPAIVMLYVGRATGAMHNWAAVMARQFQPTKHTRVGGVCLFQASLTPTEEGHAWRPKTQLIVNSYSAIALPEWVLGALTKATEGEEELPDHHEQ
jgi:hypothetical protein